MEHHCIYKWKDVRARKEGGPPPKCIRCGKPAI